MVFWCFQRVCKCTMWINGLTLTLKKLVTSSSVFIVNFDMFRSNHRGCFVKKIFLEILQKFTGKRLCQSPILIKFIKKETLAQVFPCEFCEISKNTFFTEHLWATASVCCKFSPFLKLLSPSKWEKGNGNIKYQWVQSAVEMVKLI